MATIAPHALYGMYALIKPHLKSMRIGGVVGDLSHVIGGGYHISRDDLRRHGQTGDYSIQSPADKRGPGNVASAIDITLSAAEMKLVTGRLKAAFERNDDRIEVLREFIGTLNGRDVCGFNRYRTGRRTGFYSSGYSDKSHLWHVHLSFFRAYADDANAVRGVAEVVAGLKPGALGWKGSDNSQEDELPTVKDVWTDDVIPAPDYAKKVDPKNPTWQAQSFLIEAVQQIRVVLDEVKATRTEARTANAKTEAELAELRAEIEALKAAGAAGCKEA